VLLRLLVDDRHAAVRIVLDVLVVDVRRAAVEGVILAGHGRVAGAGRELLRLRVPEGGRVLGDGLRLRNDRFELGLGLVDDRVVLGVRLVEGELLVRGDAAVA